MLLALPEPALTTVLDKLSMNHVSRVRKTSKTVHNLLQSYVFMRIFSKSRGSTRLGDVLSHLLGKIENQSLHRSRFMLGNQSLNILCRSSKPMRDMLKDSVHERFLFRSSAKIQRFWRWCKNFSSTALLSRKCLLTGAFRDAANGAEFEKFLECMSKDHVIQNFRKVISRMVVVSFRGERVQTKKFLSVFLIIHFERFVLDDNETQEEVELIDASRNLYGIMQAVFAGISTHGLGGISRDLKVELGLRLQDFLAAFTRWKDPDLARLMERIKNSLVDLGFISKMRRLYGPHDQFLVNELNTQTTRLREKVISFHPPGDGQVILDQFDLEVDVGMLPYAYNHIQVFNLVPADDWELKANVFSLVL
jgi:hypothetical protein